jgi:hypothetical protein
MRFIVSPTAVIGILSIGIGNRRDQGVLSEAGLNKTTQCNRRECGT